MSGNTKQLEELAERYSKVLSDTEENHGSNSIKTFMVLIKLILAETRLYELGLGNTDKIKELNQKKKTIEDAIQQRGTTIAGLVYSGVRAMALLNNAAGVARAAAWADIATATGTPPPPPLPPPPSPAFGLPTPVGPVGPVGPPAFGLPIAAYGLPPPPAFGLPIAAYGSPSPPAFSSPTPPSLQHQHTPPGAGPGMGENTWTGGVPSLVEGGLLQRKSKRRKSKRRKSKRRKSKRRKSKRRN